MTTEVHSDTGQGDELTITPPSTAKQALQLGAFYALMCILGLRRAPELTRIVFTIDLVVALGFVIGAAAFLKQMEWGRKLLKFCAPTAMLMTLVNMVLGFITLPNLAASHHYGPAVIVISIIMMILVALFQLSWCFIVYHQMKVAGGEAKPIQQITKQIGRSKEQ